MTYQQVGVTDGLAGFDVVNALSLMDNNTFLSDQKVRLGRYAGGWMLMCSSVRVTDFW